MTGYNDFKNREYYYSCTINNDHSELQKSLYNIQDKSHILIAYSDLTELREIYTSFTKHALENNEVVIILYHYDNPENIAYFLKDRGVDINRYENERSLLILDSYEPRFFGYNDDVFNFVKPILEKSTERGKRGISIIADMGTFFYNGNSQQSKDILFAFETAIPKKFSESIKRICLYHKDILKRIKDNEKDLLYKSHLQCFAFNDHKDITERTDK